jgi:mannose-6-phosphate isomerase-like protein (cupin superfamily)
MTNPRPAPVGLYHILQDYECPTASVRVFRMKAGSEAIAGHVHHRSMQIYVALEGTVLVDVDGVETMLKPYDVLPVWPGGRHSASAVDGGAVLMNISIPPLAADDQVPVNSAHEPPDMRLPTHDDDVND